MKTPDYSSWMGTARTEWKRIGDTVAALAAVYDSIVGEGEQLHPMILKANGKPGKQSEAHNLLRRFRLHTNTILRFISDPAVHAQRVVPGVHRYSDHVCCIAVEQLR